MDVEGEDGREVDGRGAPVGKFDVEELVVVESKGGEGVKMWELKMEVGVNDRELQQHDVWSEVVEVRVRM